MPGMSLLSSYEGLRQEIQRLAQENEELRRLVQLIQENQELKLVLRNRSSGLGFYSSTLLAEVASSPRQPRRRTLKFKDAERGEQHRARGAEPGAARPHAFGFCQDSSKEGNRPPAWLSG
ncbi:Speriolin [Myotis brandtii]|uniref:Speriolin n=1 Tax=Myotis brandtii TaxID=109478 RepID=S7PG71_MYOBR|nr:Speriolin [Myotis brandtii]